MPFPPLMDIWISGLIDLKTQSKLFKSLKVKCQSYWKEGNSNLVLLKKGKGTRLTLLLLDMEVVVIASCSCCWSQDLICLWSLLGLPSGGTMAVRTVRNQDNKRLQDAPGQSAVHPANVLHDHEPPESGQ